MAEQRREGRDDVARPPSAGDARESAKAGTVARLEKREVRLDGSESDEELVEMLEAAERFDVARAAIGASSMTNSRDTIQPENPALVLPERRADESPRAWAARVRDAADRLGTR